MTNDHTTTEETSQVRLLEQRLEVMQTRLAELEQQLRQPTDTEPTKIPTSRRRAMQLAGGAAVGALASAVAARPAAADDPNDVTLGQVKSTASRPTGSRYTGNSNGVGALFAAGGTASGASAEFPAALGAWAHTDNMPNGLYGFSDQEGGAGVVGKNDQSIFGGYGVIGVGTTYGVVGEIRNAIAGTGAAFRTQGSPAHGILAEGTATGGAFLSANTGIAVSTSRVHLDLGGVAPTPSDDGYFHQAGHVVFDVDDRLLLCVESGAPGRWRVLAGPDTAGAFHPVGPYRVYDSRLDSFPNSGPLSPGANRVVPVADGIDPDDSNVVLPNVVAPGATAVAINLTVTQTQAPNFLAVAPGDAIATGASSINWWQPGLSLANGISVPVSEDRELKVFCGPNGGATHFIVDVAGYWR